MGDETPRSRKLKLFLDEATCASCGGVCCKLMPGLTLPRDWGAPDKQTMVRRIVAALMSGDWAIDWWEGDPRPGYEQASYDSPVRPGALPKVCFVRPATVEGRHRQAILDPSWGGQCALLTDRGCPLPPDGRPAMCRTLEPNPLVLTVKKGAGCKQRLSKRDVAIAWVEYQVVIAAIIAPALREVLGEP